MSWSLAEIYRHPIKSLGEEALDEVALEAGAPLPFDRAWAISHGDTEWSPENPIWGRPGNFINQTHVPRLVQMTVRYDVAAGEVHLSHPDLGSLSVVPSNPAHHAELTAWVAPLTEGTTRKGPFAVCQAPGVAFTDFEDTHVSLATQNSLRALEQHAGQSLAHIRFRMNLWLEGPPAWSELDWVDREVEIGEVRLRIIDRDERCNATNASPSTGTRDTQIPALLYKTFGHRDFGVYAQVTRGGRIRKGDTAQLV